MQHEGEKLKQLQEASERNERLEEQIRIMGRQIELQQELASKQVQCALSQALATIRCDSDQINSPLSMCTVLIQTTAQLYFSHLYHIITSQT